MIRIRRAYPQIDATGVDTKNDFIVFDVMSDEIISEGTAEKNNA